MCHWKTTVQLTQSAIKVLVTDSEGDDLLKAQLPITPGHPRALLTLLEGLALWSRPLLVAGVCIEDSVAPSLQSDLFGLWPEESVLVRFHFAEAQGGRRRIRGVGDFRTLRRLAHSAVRGG